MQIVLITGLSGSGKSTVLKCLEDHNFYCIDNLPPIFIVSVVDFLMQQERAHVAISIDTRSGVKAQELLTYVAALRQTQYVHLIFLTAKDEVLIQRFSETRRRHPLASDGYGYTLAECIFHEKEWLSALAQDAYTVDTTGMSVNQLRFWVIEYLNSLTFSAPLTLVFESFAYKKGIPLDVNFLFDVRCLPNPHYQEGLRDKTGLDPEVGHYLMQHESVAQMIDHIAEFLLHWSPGFIYETRVLLAIGIGCTGGQHRSVFIVEALAERFRDAYPVLVRHRQIDLSTV